ncbi:4'-phosphopantetheinyl transferase superfamily protein [Okibacterium fritillariae]|uniref:4'-phosphopantetheinyl transferase superfamily protein n=1 Tax=Okibacterium fritillariae TaxID=123320 RepID=A0A1T5JD48_9MICO|nr:4'-phosphopantetheinyl transferase superfamily protein [Okibacterium fritillariae]
MFAEPVRGRVLLGATQRERWNALGNEHERRRFARSRAAVQDVVAEFLETSGLDLGATVIGSGAPHADLVLDARCPTCGGPHGPLTLAGTERTSRRSSRSLRSPRSAAPSVSLSASEEAIVVAVSDDARLGVDVDVLFSARRGVGSDDVAQRVRHVASVLGIDAGAERDVLQRWTRVEAVLKADGRGLRVDPREVSFMDDDHDHDDHDYDDHNHDYDDHNHGGAVPVTGLSRWRAIVRDDVDTVYHGSDLAVGPDRVGAVARFA